MSKNSIVRSERELNIKFIQKVEKYLVLYDKTIECYSSENDVDEAWNEVADYTGISVSECKKKWIIICQALKRNLQENEKTNRKNAKYNYLIPHLKFMIPFLKKKKTTKSSDDEDGSDDGNETEDTKDLDSLREAKRRQKKDTKYDGSMKHDNPDMSFLRSLLPDLELMNTRQKQKFKIGVLNLMNDILEQSENYTELEPDSKKISIISEQELIVKDEDT
ncbi:uncharacterized protein LOC123296074 [Chrysoperla carnea]|uniref:uncharacterized protein LOC123296074 n=1 Tax=Chrysoperla carnea TaxID=189513 RepID=UPI001D05C495|nr:uncharacterized protein LOC123296074 [Chrysoperla carnea]